MKKKLLSVVLTGLMILGLTACGSGDAQSSEDKDLLQQIQEKGTLTVAMEGTWAPWTYHDEDDNLVGFDVEVAQKIAEKLGVEVTFVEGEWDGLFAGLDSGRYDMVVTVWRSRTSVRKNTISANLTAISARR